MRNFDDVSTLTRVDASDPENNLAIDRTIDEFGGVSRFQVAANNIYLTPFRIGNAMNAMVALTARNPLRPELVGSVDTVGNFPFVSFVDEDYVYMSGSGIQFHRALPLQAQ